MFRNAVGGVKFSRKRFTKMYGSLLLELRGVDGCTFFRKNVTKNVWFNVIRITRAWVGVNFTEKKALRRMYVWFNVIIITRAWVGVHFPEKKCYIT